jgi:ribonucleoside-diphosphate reductase alpha chain
LPGQDGYFHVGLYDDGAPAEFFIEVSKSGATLHGFASIWAIAVSLALQHGCSPETLVDKFREMRFDPSGMTDNPKIRTAWSLADYWARYMEYMFINKEPEEVLEEHRPTKNLSKVSFDGPPCSKCGNLTKRNGSCHVCVACGSTTGCS